MRDAIPLGRIAGFVVNVHWSVLVILWLFTWSLATMLPGTVGGYPAVVYWLLGAGGAVMCWRRCWLMSSRTPSSLVAPGYPLRA